MTSQANAQAASVATGGVKQRTLLVLGIVAYVACFQWMYVHYLYQEFAYFGYDYNPPGVGYSLMAWTFSVLPSLWMPLEVRRPSHLAYWVLYITVIIPSMFVPLYAGLNTPAEVSLLMVTLFLGFSIAGSSYLLQLFPIDPPKISSGVFWRAFGCVSGALALWLIVVFRHHMQIVSFYDVYDVRDAANDVQEGSLVNYAEMWLSGAINPFLMGCGLHYKKSWMFIIGALGQVLVYSVGGSKSSVLSIAFMLGFHILFKFGRFAFSVKLTFALLALSGGLCLSYYFSGESPGLMHFLILSVLFQRTLSAGGLVTGQYYHFFLHNPLTYLSHVKGVSWFVPYPYKYPIGQEIGLAYAGTTGLDATAHFWASDGIGGFGLPGVILMSLLCALVFWALDSAAKRWDPRLAALVISFAALNLANASIFTSLLSGGLALLILLLFLMPPENGPGFGTSLGKLESSAIEASSAS